MLHVASMLGVNADEPLLPERSERCRSADARIGDGADGELARAGYAV